MSRGYPTVEILTSIGGSTLFNVNGSVTPVEFTYAPPADHIVAINSINFIMSATGNVNQLLTKFMDLPALINGIDLDMNINFSLRNLPGLVKTNFDLFRFFKVEYTQGIIGTANMIDGVLGCSPPMVLDGSKGDYFRIRIRDDLSGLQAASVMLVGKLYIV